MLQIVVWDHPELAAALGQPAQNAKTTDAAPGFLIDENGDVQFPYAGTVHVAGKDVAIDPEGTAQASEQRVSEA